MTAASHKRWVGRGTVDADHDVSLGAGPMTVVPTRGAAGWIVPPRVGRALLIACWLGVLYGTAAVVSHPATLRGITAWACALVFLVTFTVALQRHSAANLILVSGLAGVGLQLAAPGNAAFLAVVATIAVAGLRLTPQFGRVVALVSGFGFVLASAISDGTIASRSLAGVVPGLLFTYVGATAVGRLRLEQRRAEELLAEVIEGRDARVRAAALDERARLAREMHDVLAHTLSALSIQLEGTRLLAEQSSCDPSLTSALERASGLAKEGLVEARRAVGSLWDEALPGPDLLPQLAQEFENDTGVSCCYEIEGRPVDLPADVRLALYRIAQEALTNVRKHADASAVTMTLRYGRDGIELAVENEGTPRGSPLAGGGYGLRGMRERAELLSGTLDAGQTATGFRVHLWVPTQTASPSVS